MAIITLERAKLFNQITTSTKDALIDALIPQVEGDFLLIRNKAFDEDSNDEVEYPEGSELIAAQMIGYLLSAAGRSGLSSERIGDYAYTAQTGADMVMGYPKAIVGRIERYIGFK